MSTSPESDLKNIMAAQSGNIFAISPAFRNIEAAGPTHLPEFLMVEWYREKSEYGTIMDDAQKLISTVTNQIKGTIKFNYQNKHLNLSGIWPKLSLNALWKKYTGVEFTKLVDDDRMSQFAANKGFSPVNATWEQMFNQIFLNLIEPTLGNNPVYVTDYPTRISPLCAPKPDQPKIAQRFELYICGMELGNGNTENTDANSVRKSFAAEQKYRAQHNLETSPIDENFLESLTRIHNTQIAGMGLGIDRLAMLLSDVDDIRSVNPMF